MKAYNIGRLGKSLREAPYNGFSRADLLFEVNTDGNVVFTAGTLSESLGVKPATVEGSPFVELFDPADRKRVTDIVSATPLNARTDQVLVKNRCAARPSVPALLSGHWISDFGPQPMPRTASVVKNEQEAMIVKMYQAARDISAALNVKYSIFFDIESPRKFMKSKTQMVRNT